MNTLLKITAAVAALVIGISYVFLKPTEQRELSSSNQECIKDNNQLLSFRGSVDSSKLTSINDKLSSLSFETVNLTDSHITFITGSFANKSAGSKARRQFVAKGKDSSGFFEDFLTHDDHIFRQYYNGSSVRFPKSQYKDYSKNTEYLNIDLGAVSVEKHIEYVQEGKFRSNDNKVSSGKAEKISQFEIQIHDSAVKRYRLSKESTGTVFSGTWVEAGKDAEQTEMMQHFVRLAEELKQECDKEKR